MIVVRPGSEVLRRVDDMLDAVEQQRAGTADVEQALDAQHAGAVRLQQHREPDAEGRPVQRRVEDDREGVGLVGAVLVAGVVGVVGGLLVGAVVVAVAARCPGSAVPLRRQLVGDDAEVAHRCGEQVVGMDLALDDRQDGRMRVDPAQAVGEGCCGPRLGDVALGHDEAVGDGGLLRRLGLAGELVGAVHCVHGRDDAVEPVVRLHHPVGEQREEDRGRLGKAGRLDRDAAEARDLAGVHPVDQVAQLVGEVAAQRAAEAAGIEQHGALVHAGQQVMVDADLAQLVDDHGRLAHVGVREQARQQRRLARAEEAGEQRQRDALVGSRDTVVDRSSGQAAHAAAWLRRSISAGSSGSSGPPFSCSAITQSLPRSGTGFPTPFQLRST